MVCRICGNENNNRLVTVKERQLNNGEEFQYLKCSKCGTLSLYENVIDMGKYYKKDYYAYNVNSKRGLKTKLIDCLVSVGYKLITQKIIPLSKIHFTHLPHVDILYGTNVNKNSAILDVGGGAGEWLNNLFNWGFKDLTCVDKFSQTTYEKIKYVKGDIFELSNSKKYDLIAFNHSFEHMDNPDKVLQKASELLAEDGIILIRIPVMDKLAWKLYNADWFQIDAPRHIFLYTENAMKLLCDRNKLNINQIIFDASNLDQFKISEKYRETKKSTDECVKEISRTKEDRKIVRILNKYEQSDQACFLISKK